MDLEQTVELLRNFIAAARRGSLRSIRRSLLHGATGEQIRLGPCELASPGETSWLTV